MRVLVLGGNGFIGSHLVDRLLAAGDQVRVLDRSAARTDVRWDGKVEYLRGELQDASLLASAVSGVDVVYHLMSSTVPGSANLDPAADVQSNLLGGLRLLETMKEAGLPRLVFFSSGGTVYGNAPVCPVAEDHALEPIGSYGIVKCALEGYVRMYTREYGLPSVILRPSNPFGPRQSASGGQGVIAAFLHRVQRGEKLSIWGDGSAVRDYLYVGDLAEAAYLAGHCKSAGIYNIGSGVGLSVNELVALIRMVTGREIEVEHLPARSFDVSRIVLDVARAKDELGWQPSVPTIDGIANAWRALVSAASAEDRR